jgi:murein DD-endopeptidase MepM/ murein hydrolase activator NlpD
MILTDPLYKPTVRVDSVGDGNYGASRKRKVKGKVIKYRHKGVDFITTPGDYIKSPITGEIVWFGYAYKTDNAKEKLRSIHIKGVGEFSNVKIKILYCTLRELFKKGDKICQGDIFALAQDNAQRYKSMINHMHIEIRINGVLVDPLKYFKL